MEDERTNEDEGWDPTRAIEGEPRRDRDTERERERKKEVRPRERERENRVIDRWR